jgi:hypothetical protein
MQDPVTHNRFRARNRRVPAKPSPLRRLSGCSMEDLENRTLLSALTITGTANADTITVKGHGADTLVWINKDPAVAAPDYQAVTSTITDLTIDAGDGDDAILMDYSAGASPLGTAVVVSGGAGDNSLTVSGGMLTLTSDLGAGDSKVSLVTRNDARVNLHTTQHIQSLTVSDTSKVAFDASEARLLVINALSITDSGKLDLNNNDLILRYAPTDSAGQLAHEDAIEAYVRNWYVNRSGPMLMASHADAADFSGNGRSLAVFDNHDVHAGQWAGEALDDFNQIIVRYDYMGDANGDGVVDPTDYAMVDGNQGKGHSWVTGDLNFDGKVDPTDYAQIDGNQGAGYGGAGGARLLVSPTVPEVASTSTVYVDFALGSDNGQGTSDSPWKTLSKAFLARGYDASDVVDIRVRNGGVVPIATPIDLSQGGNDGASFTIEPDVPGERVVITCNSAWMIAERGLQTRTSVTLKHVDISGSLSMLVYQGSDTPALNFTCLDCNLSTTNPSAILFDFGNAFTGAPNITLRDTAVTDFSCAINSSTIGAVVIDHCRFTNSNALARSYFYMHGWESWIVNDSQFFQTGDVAGNSFYYDGGTINPRTCTWSNVLVDWSKAAGGSTQILFYLPAMGAGSSNTLTWNWTGVRLIEDNPSNIVARFGLVDNTGMQRDAELAAVNNRWGDFSLADCDFINLDTSHGLGGGLSVGLGLGEGGHRCIVDRCFIQNGDALHPAGHGLEIDANNALVTNTVSTGYLDFVVFGNNVTLRNDTAYGYASSLVLGRTGDGVWEPAQNMTIIDCVFQANAADPRFLCATDYAYNIPYTAQSPFTGLLDQNDYYAPGGTVLANIDRLKCSTLEQMQNVWRASTLDGSGNTAWGSHPTNDSGSLNLDPEFQAPSIAGPDGGGGRYGFAPGNSGLGRADGSYAGALPPS